MWQGSCLIHTAGSRDITAVITFGRSIDESLYSAHKQSLVPPPCGRDKSRLCVFDRTEEEELTMDAIVFIEVSV